MYNDQPQHIVYEKFLNLMYGDQPVGRLISGTSKSVKALTRNDLIKYHKLQYIPNRTVISISGSVESSFTGSLYLGLETSDAYSIYFGEQELLKNSLEKTDEYERKIHAVTSSDIQKVAKLFSKKGVARLATIGPQKDPHEFEKNLI